MEITLIWGPTSTGKTAASVELALACSAPVIALDRFQSFTEIATGSGRPRHEELKSTTRLYLTDRKMSEGLLHASEANTLLKKRVAQCALYSEKIIIEGGSISALNEMISDPYWGSDEFRWTLYPFYMGDAQRFLKKARYRIQEMFDPGVVGVASLLDELITCWSDTQLQSLVVDIDGYRAAIAFAQRNGYSIPKLKMLAEVEKTQLINEIADEYLQHAIWQQKTMLPIPNTWRRTLPSLPINAMSDLPLLENS